MMSVDICVMCGQPIERYTAHVPHHAVPFLVVDVEMNKCAFCLWQLYEIEQYTLRIPYKIPHPRTRLDGSPPESWCVHLQSLKGND